MDRSKLISWLAGAFALAIALFATLPAGKVRGFDMNGFGRLPVLEGGRVKPLDSVARNSMLLIKGSQVLRYEGRTISPDEWILDVLFRADVADSQPIFQIDDTEVLSLIGQPQTAGRYYSFKTLQPHLDEIQKQAASAEPIEAKSRTRFQSAVVNLFSKVYLYFQLRNTLQSTATPGLSFELRSLTDAEAPMRHRELAQAAFFRPFPPPPGQPDTKWMNVGEALGAAAQGSLNPALAPMARVSAAYAGGDANGFNQAVAELQSAVTAAHPVAVSHADSELVFNRAQPFYLGMLIYVAAFLVLAVSWLWKPELLQRTAYSLLCAGAIVHTVGLAARIILQGRPPVTNLYSSAVFVGWAAVVLGVIIERMYKKGFGTAVAAAAGFGSLIVAQHLATSGDTMEMMRAVLDSNFWLATHVVTITIGYSGTFLAGAIAIGYAIRKHIVTTVDPETDRALEDMTYGVICFALFFSFVGTVLGGIWADQSWGRFWGWDPKENGALLIVLWNAIILHARWSGMARERGIMTMAIFGNIITSLSWFGVNMLGVGLHSYGFMDEAFWALTGFIASQVLFMGIAMAPPRFWAAKPPAKA